MKQILILFIVFFIHSILWSQCTPPYTLNITDAPVLCSLSQLNGMTCTLVPFSNFGKCTLCKNQFAKNISWWSFIAEGGPATITINVGSCTRGNAMMAGLNESEECGNNPLCETAISQGQIRLSSNLVACKIYYLWVSGYPDEADCEFTVSTTGKINAPPIPTLNNINNSTNKIISICEGVCEFPIYVTPKSSGCITEYSWTLNGEDLFIKANNLILDFPNSGNFQICATGYIGSPEKNICQTIGPECATIAVRKLNQKIGPDRYLCSELIPYEWHDQFILKNSVYTAHLTQKNCCPYDSVVRFIILPKPIPAEIIHIGQSNSDYYIDPTTKIKYDYCQSKNTIDLPNVTKPFQCDSSYLLTTYFLNLSSEIKLDCREDYKELKFNVKNSSPSCGIEPILDYQYHWYLKSDTLKQIIGTNEYLRVEKNEDYCITLSVNVKIEQAIKKFTFDYCEQLTEITSDLSGGTLNSDKSSTCINGESVFKILIPNHETKNSYIWKVTNGDIISPSPDSSDQIQVKWHGAEQKFGEVCVVANRLCEISPLYCQKVLFRSIIETLDGNQSIQKGLNGLLIGTAHSGTWKLIKGPGIAIFETPNKFITTVQVSKYGIYHFKWSYVENECIHIGITSILFSRK